MSQEMNQEDPEQHQHRFNNDFYLSEDAAEIKELEYWLNQTKRANLKSVFNGGDPFLNKLVGLIKDHIAHEKEFFDGQHPAYKGFYTQDKINARRKGSGTRAFFALHTRTEPKDMGNPPKEADVNSGQDIQREVSVGSADSVGSGQTEQKGSIPVVGDELRVDGGETVL